eukprot:219949-Amphidinium_carterae.5
MRRGQPWKPTAGPHAPEVQPRSPTALPPVAAEEVAFLPRSKVFEHCLHIVFVPFSHRGELWMTAQPNMHVETLRKHRVLVAYLAFTKQAASKEEAFLEVFFTVAQVALPWRLKVEARLVPTCCSTCDMSSHLRFETGPSSGRRLAQLLSWRSRSSRGSPTHEPRTASGADPMESIAVGSI